MKKLYPGYTLGFMKTAISIPQGVFETAEKYAAEKAMSRSKLYTQALKDFLDRQRDDAITAKLNEIYATEDSSLDPQMRRYQIKKLRKVQW